MESGVDLGGPRREFFRLLVFETSTTYFIGKEGHKFFLTDMKALQDRDYFSLGQYCAASIIQGGNGFPFFDECVFSYFVHGTCTGINVNSSDIPYDILKCIIEKVCSCFDLIIIA
jgi:hypothetical protein